MKLDTLDALGDDDLRAVIAAGFEQQCRVLCFGPAPSWADVEARLRKLRDML